MESISIIKVEEYKYHIIYATIDSKYGVYKRLDQDNWQVYQSGKWSVVKSSILKLLESNYQSQL